ncbi:hypothetical protein [Pseudomonas sp. GL-B-26]|uniref:hypothetical protein n=1 Tax=unclassified Pseudomonas TaxID=196821 RepID=UPI001CBC869C|nr:hypothetical protein [Pseudomonas sp. GL-B-26]
MNSDDAVCQENPARRVYACSAAERSLAVLDSCYNNGCVTFTGGAAGVGVVRRQCE